MPRYYTTPAPGTRVRLARDVDRYPHFIAAAGSVGTVVDIGDANIFAVRIDEHLPGAEEWENEVHWILDAGDDPSGDVEQVDAASAADFVNRDALRAASDDDLWDIVAAGGPAALIDAAQAEISARGEVS